MEDGDRLMKRRGVSLDDFERNPALIASLDNDAVSDLAARIWGLLYPTLLRRFFSDCVAAQTPQPEDRVLSLKEISAAIRIHPQTIRKNWRRRYASFMWQDDGKRLYGSSARLQKWLSKLPHPAFAVASMISLHGMLMRHELHIRHLLILL